MDDHAVEARGGPAIAYRVVVVDFSQPLIHPAVALYGFIGPGAFGTSARLADLIGKVGIAQAVEPRAVGQPRADAGLLLLKPGQVGARRLKKRGLPAGFRRNNGRAKFVKPHAGAAIYRDNPYAQRSFQGRQVKLRTASLHFVNHGHGENGGKSQIKDLGKYEQAGFQVRPVGQTHHHIGTLGIHRGSQCIQHDALVVR